MTYLRLESLSTLAGLSVPVVVVAMEGRSGKYILEKSV